MLDSTPRFDMKRAPMRQHLGWLIHLLSAVVLRMHRNRIERENMEGIKAPYLLLCNHNAFMDFMVASHVVFPSRANFVVAIDGYLKREWLLRFIGCICKRKFTNDIQLVRHLRTVVQRGDIAAIYPEARYSLCGTTAVLPDSLGKLAKILNVPVVVLICHGHHVNSPFFNLPDHHVKGTRALAKCILRPEDMKNMTPAQISERIRESFVYDDYAWQKEQGIRITYKNRAVGLQKVLYQCPACKTEYRMASEGTELFCKACGKRWRMTELGELEAESGETEFSHIPDWYEWERENVRREVREGRYDFTCKAHVDALPNAKGYIHLGAAELRHGPEGFRLTGHDGTAPYEVKITVPEHYSVHIEYEYLGKYGDCVDLNTLTDTLYVYPEGEDFAVTKIALATEELYALEEDNRRKGKVGD
jgi:1-acyl-sn-glycerol-3-phosphate acyltransferase/DNA-directed RNA polymerase subunit RPC12/RpoP